MRTTTTRLAKQVTERFLTPGNPTGLTGLRTHAAPRPALINLYNRTLKALQQFPKDSAYRTSVEAITRHRLSIIEGAKPENYDAWYQRVAEKHPELVQEAKNEGYTFAIEPRSQPEWDDRLVEWDASGLEQFSNEGPRTDAEHDKDMDKLERRVKDLETKAKTVDIEPEPPLTAEQINELEQKFSAGLIEEVIEVAKGELHLVEVMKENKVWEELVEKIPEGQWGYFERARHVKETQKPSS